MKEYTNVTIKSVLDEQQISLIRYNQCLYRCLNYV